MSLKEWIFGKGDSQARKIAKAEKKILNMHLQSPDRQYFLYQLREDASILAVQSLLKRFTVSCENTVFDRDEKETTCNYLVEIGETAIEPLKHHLRTHNIGVNWPFRALTALLEPDQLKDFLIEILDAIGPEYVRDPERKEQMVLTAKDFPDERVSRAVLPYLDDHSETIRFLACETLFTHAHEFARLPILAHLKNEDSHRVIARIVDGFIALGWQVDDPQAIAAKLPHGVRISANKTLQH